METTFRWSGFVCAPVLVLLTNCKCSTPLRTNFQWKLKTKLGVCESLCDQHRAKTFHFYNFQNPEWRDKETKALTLILIQRRKKRDKCQNESNLMSFLVSLERSFFRPKTTFSSFIGITVTLNVRSWTVCSLKISWSKVKLLNDWA